MIKLTDILNESSHLTNLPPAPAKKAPVVTKKIQKMSAKKSPVKKSIPSTKVNPNVAKQQEKKKQQMVKATKQKKIKQLKVKNPSTGKPVLAVSVYKKGPVHPLYKLAKDTIEKFKSGGKPKKKGKK